MASAERREQILAILKTREAISIRELAALVYTSEASVRRDAAALEEEGLVRRIYGGVQLKENAVVPFASKEEYLKAIDSIMLEGEAIKYNGTQSASVTWTKPDQ